MIWKEESERIMNEIRECQKDHAPVKEELILDLLDWFVDEDFHKDFMGKIAHSGLKEIISATIEKLKQNPFYSENKLRHLENMRQAIDCVDQYGLDVGKTLYNL